MALDILHSLVDNIAGAPGIRHLREWQFDKHFDNNPGLNLFRGVYDSYEQAADAIPAAQRAGYDSDEAAELYTNWLEVFDYDYPSLFWIAQSITAGMRTVFDLGGNLGIKYYAYDKLIDFPKDVRWVVSDVPAVVRRGRTFAADKGVGDKLQFVDDLESMGRTDVLFASGSLQYLPKTLAELLTLSADRPKRLLVNITPIHPTADFYTVNSFGPGFCAYHVQERGRFVADVEAAGYRLRAEWRNPGKPLEILARPDLSLRDYAGFCFDRV